MTISSVKHIVLSSSRCLHLRLFKRALPEKLAVYAHALEPADQNALRVMVSELRARGYEFVTPDEFLSARPGERVLFLSFDDNFGSWHTSLPLFDELNIRATFYINAGVLAERSSPEQIANYFATICHDGERVPLTAGQIQDIARAGHTIASHTLSHVCLTAVPADEAKEQIRLGKTALEEIVGGPVVHFSFPFGLRRHFNESLRSYCAQIGIRTVASARPIPHAAHTPLRINRILWRLGQSLEYNLANLSIDGRAFEALTGRSPVGD